MFKVYHEHENFGSYTAFDLALGKSYLIDKETFDNFENNKLKYLNEVLSPSHTRFPRRVYFQITRNCQLSCSYCYVKAGPKQAHLERQVILDLIDYLGKNGLMDVRLTGGEATVHPNFIEICERFFKNNIYVSIGTNGLWSNHIKEFLANQPYFCLAVTVDGSELSHIKYRQNTHQTLINNLRELREKNPYIRIRINMVVTKSNKYQYPSLIHFAEEINAESLTFLPLRPRLDNPELSKEVLSADEFRELAYNTRNIRSTEKFACASSDNPIESPENGTFAFLKNRTVCRAGRERIDLSFNATERKIAIFGCTFSPAMEETIDRRIRDEFISGEFDYNNIDKLLDIWHDDSRWDIYRDRSLKTDACSTCSSFGKNCGGTGFCHIQNHKYRKLKLNENIKQQLYKQMKELPSWCKYTPN